MSVTQDPYAYAANDPVNMVDPLGLAPWDVAKDAWDATGGKVVSGTSNFVEDPGGFVQRNRHTIIDIGTGIAAATVVSTICVGTGGIGCAAIGLSATFIGSTGIHVASDAAFDDEYRISVGEALFRSGTSTTIGAFCGYVFTKGCLTGLAAHGRSMIGASAVVGYAKLLRYASLQQGWDEDC